MEMKKMMKRAGLGLMLAAAMAGMAGCGGNGNKESASKPAAGAKVAKVGFLNGVSGGVASYGLAEKEGFDLAVEEVNKEGKIHFDVEMADTKGNVQQCVSAAQKMIAAKKVLVVGPLISGEYKAVGPLFQKAQIPLLGAATTAEGLIEIGDYMFRNCVPESKNIPQTVQKTHKLLGYKNVAVLYSNNNEHQVSAYKTFVKALEAEGVNIVATETFADKDTDFSAQLTKIHNVNPDAVVVAGYYQEGGLILKKMREMGMNQPVLGDNGFVSPELLKIAGAAADNVYVSSMWSADRNSQATKDFVKNFKAKYNHDPDNFAACAYVSVRLAAKAMEDAGTTTDSKKVREALANVKNFESAVGPMTFNNSGDPDVDLVLLKVEGGKYVTLNQWLVTRKMANKKRSLIWLRFLIAYFQSIHTCTGIRTSEPMASPSGFFAAVKVQVFTEAVTYFERALKSAPDSFSSFMTSGAPSIFPSLFTYTFTVRTG